MKTRKQNRNNKRTERERFEWFIERIQMHRVLVGWANARVKKSSCPKNFLEIDRYFALTSYCNTIGQSNNAFSILGFSLAGKRRVHVFIFLSIGWQNNKEHLPKLFFKVIRKSLYHPARRASFCLLLEQGENKQAKESLHWQGVYSKEPKSLTAFDLFTFFRTDLNQSEARWKLSSTSDWLMSAWKNVS